MQVQAISMHSVQPLLQPLHGNQNFKAFRKIWPQGHGEVRPNIGYAPAAYTDTAVDAEAFLRCSTRSAPLSSMSVWCTTCWDLSKYVTMICPLALVLKLLLEIQKFVQQDRLRSSCCPSFLLADPACWHENGLLETYAGIGGSCLDDDSCRLAQSDQARLT